MKKSTSILAMMTIQLVNCMLFFNFSCASIPNCILQDAKTLEKGNFEFHYGGGLGSATPTAIAEDVWGDNYRPWKLYELGTLGFYGRMHEGFKFRAGLVSSLDMTQELWVSSFFFTNFHFVSKTRLKYSPVPDHYKFQIALMPTFTGIIGPADIFKKDTAGNDITVTFDAIGAELPLIMSIHTGKTASPYIAVNPVFLKINFDQYEELEVPEYVYPFSLNFNVGLQIVTKMFSLSPELSYNCVFYKRKFIYNTICFGVSGGVRIKKRDKFKDKTGFY